MNAIHSPSESDATIAELRRLLPVIDTEVITAYGWDDLEVAYDFHAFDGGSENDKWRWALSPDAASILLGRLVALNRERFETASVAQSNRRASSRTRRQATAEYSQHSLDLEAGTAIPTKSPSKRRTRP